MATPATKYLEKKKRLRTQLYDAMLKSGMRPSTAKLATSTCAEIVEVWLANCASQAEADGFTDAPDVLQKLSEHLSEELV